MLWKVPGPPAWILPAAALALVGAVYVCGGPWASASTALLLLLLAGRLRLTHAEFRGQLLQAQEDLEHQGRELARLRADNERALAELSSALDVARCADRTRNEFVANISHELRTPLHAIVGMTDLLVRELSGEPATWAGDIQVSSEELLGLVREVLDWTALEAGSLTIEPQDFDLRAALEETAASFIAPAGAKGLDLRVLVHADVPERARGDVVRLRQVLGELLNNAVKFTDEGSVRMHASVREPCELVCVVEDTGPGIELERLDELLRPFRQGDNSTTRLHRGSGLGLALAARVVEALGGSLSIGARDGGGSAVRLRIPLARPTLRDADAAGLRVLVVDDQPLNRRVVEQVLQRAGHGTLEACDGVEALERFQRDDVDLILMDIQMPRMDGFETARRIRALEAEHGGARTPIVALTAGAFAGGRERCLEAGMDEFMTKPFRPRELLGVLESVASARR